MDNEQNTQEPVSVAAISPKKRNWKYTILGAAILIGAFFLIAYKDLAAGFKEWQANNNIKAQINECIRATGETEVTCAMEVGAEIYKTDHKTAYSICEKYMGNGTMNMLVRASCDVYFMKEDLGIK